MEDYTLVFIKRLNVWINDSEKTLKHRGCSLDLIYNRPFLFMCVCLLFLTPAFDINDLKHFAAEYYNLFVSSVLP